MQDHKQAFVLPIALIVLFLIFIFSLMLYSEPKDPTVGGSTFAVAPTEMISPSPEPLILSWTKYNNGVYNFAIDVPDTWKVQDYAPAYRSGGTLVAFSPDDLPCATCSYFRNGFFSIKVYNEKTSPEDFAEFSKKAKNIGKSPQLQLVEMGQKKAVVFANTITTEHQGWVYEIILDKPQPGETITDSRIMRRVISSFAFTGLQFGNE